MAEDLSAYLQIAGVKVTLHARLGTCHMRLRDVESLRAGAVVTLDRLAGEPVEVLCRGQIVARGEVMIQDEAFALRITEIVERGQIEETRTRRVGRSRK